MIEIRAVFISYRRDGTQGEARALYNALVPVLGEKNVFLDVDTIPLTSDFRDAIRARIETSDLFILIIGRAFLAALGPVDQGAPRPSDNLSGSSHSQRGSDFLRFEIEHALQKKVAILPVLVQAAGMPTPDQLPECIRALAYRGAFEIRHNHWNRDVAELLRRLGLQRRRSPFLIAVLAALVTTITAAGGWYYVLPNILRSDARNDSPARPIQPDPNTTPRGSNRTGDASAVTTAPTHPPAAKPVPSPMASTPQEKRDQDRESQPRVTDKSAATSSVTTTSIEPPKSTTTVIPAPSVESLRAEALQAAARLRGPEGADIASRVLASVFPSVRYDTVAVDQAMAELRQQISNANERQLKRVLDMLPRR